MKCINKFQRGDFMFELDPRIKSEDDIFNPLNWRKADKYLGKTGYLRKHGILSGFWMFLKNISRSRKEMNFYYVLKKKKIVNT